MMMNVESESNAESLDIAIIGMSGRFPGARNIEEFWRNLKEGNESISFFTDEELKAAGVDPILLEHPGYVKAAPVLEGTELFDASFFGFNPREATIMDPQHRIFLECSWEALENAGYDPETYSGLIGVYAGASMPAYLLLNLLARGKFMVSADAVEILIGNDKDYLTSRVAFKLNLKGPAVSVQTACSTSLVAVHLACQGLLNYQCDIALAGGVAIRVPPKSGYIYQEGMIFSPDGHCRPFDAKAQGTVFGSGVGIVVLRRLADALADGDCISAVIKGSAINNDGAWKTGYTAPSVGGQAQVIAAAFAMAGVEPDTITAIETHGTGTPLGDPIEIAALTRVFRARTQKIGFCAVSSLKSNVGHLETAAGIAGLIKTVLALKHKQLPPSLHFKQANPQINFEDGPFYVNTSCSEWKVNEIPRRAGVSSFGIGGTNVHVILEEAPGIDISDACRPWQLLVLSAKTASALEATTANFVEHLKRHPETSLADVAYTLQVGRRPFAHRRMLVCRDTLDAVRSLSPPDGERVLTHYQDYAERPVAYMFPGPGTQYPNMGRELYEAEPAFREQVDLCSGILESHLGFDLRTLLYPPEGHAQEAAQRLTQTSVAQPALFVTEYALAALLRTWGLSPRAMIGHSIGEYVAACLSGVFSLETALMLVAVRGRLMQALPAGGMLSVRLSAEELKPFISERVSLAAINAPDSCVVAGSLVDIAALERRLSVKGSISCRLHTSHAFHSVMMEPILEPFTDILNKVPLSSPTIPYVSNLSGDWVTAAQAVDPSYWAKHVREPVRFSSGVAAFLKKEGQVLLEVGPGQTLGTLARQSREYSSKQIVLSSMPPSHDVRQGMALLLETLGRLWLSGVQVEWTGFHGHERRHRVPLPTYPFERERYWIEAATQLTIGGQPIASQTNGSAATAFRPADTDVSAVCSEQRHLVQRAAHLPEYVAPKNEIEETLAEIWGDVLRTKGIGIYDNFFLLGGDSLTATQIYSRFKEAFSVSLSFKELLSCQTIAELSHVIQRAIQLEGNETQAARASELNYYCAFELRIGDEEMTFYLTEEDYHQRGVPEGGRNFRVL